MKTRTRFTRFIGMSMGGLVFGALVGSVGGGMANADRASTDITNAKAVAPDYQRNSSGQTYGSVRDAPRPDLEPDLILVETTDGMTGYAYKTDLDGPPLRSPEEAIAWQKSQGGKERSIPVYLSDGATLIGEFVMRPSATPGGEIVSK